MTLIPEIIYQNCLNHFATVYEHPHIVKNAIPIPFFGDVSAYLASPRRILTVALNPSNVEFPAIGSSRFNISNGLSGPEGLEFELSNYFKWNPYRKWFSAFEHVLSGLDASFGGIQSIGNYTSTAIHLDLCSPIATCPTWSKLDPDQKNVLIEQGRKTFDAAVDALKPEIIIASVGWRNIQSWKPEFKNGREWEACVTYFESKNGKKLRSPLLVQTKKIKTNLGHAYLFANATAANMPFGRFTNDRKVTSGKALLEKLISA